jgi:hypothetical protein
MQQQNGNGVAGGRKIRARRVRGSMKVLGICALALLAGCSRPAFIARPVPTQTGEVLVRIENPGTTRVEVERGKQTPPWDALAMRNAGNAPLRNLQFWGLGRHSLIVSPGGEVKPESVYSPFALLPGEELALSSPTGPKAPQGQIFGILHWLSPGAPEQLGGCFMRVKNARIVENGAIALTPGEGEAYVQLELSAPLTYESVRLAWEAEPAPYEPQVWFNLSGDVWARKPLASRVDWLHPAELAPTIAGYRRFWIRLVYEVPKAGSKEAGRGEPPQTLIIKRIRIDREMQGPGKLKSWKTGKNSFDVTVEGKDVNLEIRMRGKKAEAKPLGKPEGEKPAEGK